MAQPTSAVDNGTARLPEAQTGSMTESSPHLQIDPGLAVCWETEETVRVGFERPHARIEAASAPAQRALRALVAGLPEHEAVHWRREAADWERDHAAGTAHAERTKTPEHTAHPERAAVLAAADPVLVRCDSPRRAGPRPAAATPGPIRAAMGDDGRPLRGVRAALEADGLCRFNRDGAPPELAIQVIRFLEPLERTRRWLGMGVPHLVIRFTDETARVGPVVSAEGAPCHACEALALVDADPALPGLAAQLIGTVPSSETPEVAAAVGTIAAHLVRAWQRGAAWVRDTQLLLPVSRGVPTAPPVARRISVHPECGCALVSGECPPQQ